MPDAPLPYRPEVDRSCRTCGLTLPRVHSTTIVELVTGPPAAGKTTLVLERMERGEIIVDLDRIWKALSAQTNSEKPDELVQSMLAVRDEIVRALAEFAFPRVWIVACAPTARQRAEAIHPYDAARLTVLEAPADECKRRLRAREGSHWSRLVDKWWRRYQRPSEDEGWQKVTIYEGVKLE